MESFTYAGLLYLLAIVAFVGYLNNRLQSKKEGFAGGNADFVYVIASLIGIIFLFVFGWLFYIMLRPQGTRGL